MSTQSEIVAELENFYRYYIDVFNREDPRFYDCFGSTYAMLSGERGVTTVTNDENHRNNFRRTMEQLRQRGWVRSGIDAVHAWALGENLGMIMSDVTRYKAGDAVLEKIRACYTLRRDGAAWKIITLTEIRAPFLGPGDVPR